VLVDFERPAKPIEDALLKRGVIVRPMGGYGLPSCLRITIGDELACRLVARVVAEFMAGQG
jgi:histidinol-phosphate aminotransferase